MSVFWTILVILGILLAILAASLFAVSMVEGWQAERRRQQILAQQSLADARIQMHTTQAAQAMYDTAREAMGMGSGSTISSTWAEQTDRHGHG